MLKRNLEKEALTILNYTKQQRCGTDKHKPAVILSRRTLASPVVFQTTFYLFRRQRVRTVGRSYHPALFDFFESERPLLLCERNDRILPGSGWRPGRAWQMLIQAPRFTEHQLAGWRRVTRGHMSLSQFWGLRDVTAPSEASSGPGSCAPSRK